MWREYSENAPDTDYALSFQETSGCRAIWDMIVSMCSIPGQFNGNRHYNGTLTSLLTHLFTHSYSLTPS